MGFIQSPYSSKKLSPQVMDFIESTFKCMDSQESSGHHYFNKVYLAAFNGKMLHSLVYENSKGYLHFFVPCAVNVFDKRVYTYKHVYLAGDGKIKEKFVELEGWDTKAERDEYLRSCVGKVI